MLGGATVFIDDSAVLSVPEIRAQFDKLQFEPAKPLSPEDVLKGELELQANYTSAAKQIGLTVKGIDFIEMEVYQINAEAKGLKDRTVFLRYCLRNAILPQVTAVALALGQILSGAVLVEVIFGYPGIGTLLFQAIRENDHFLIQGIVFLVIVGLGLATLILDLCYPLMDPRISHRGGK